MAYISKEEVKVKNEKLKVLNKQYGVKARFSGSNSSTLLLKITQGRIDFIGNHIAMLQVADSLGLIYYNIESAIAGLKNENYIQVNNYHLSKNFAGIALEYLQKAYAIMLEGHFDKSDVQTDYFHCAWYNSIHIGAWNKGYLLVQG